MGRKNVVKSYKMFDQEDISTSATSSITSVINQDKASISVSWSGTSPVGTLTVEARNGKDESFYTLEFGAPIPISGNTGDHQLILSEMPFTDIRIQYTSTSGTGTMDAIITSKTVGA